MPFVPSLSNRYPVQARFRPYSRGKTKTADPSAACPCVELEGILLLLYINNIQQLCTSQCTIQVILSYFLPNVKPALQESTFARKSNDFAVTAQTKGNIFLQYISTNCH